MFGGWHGEITNGRKVRYWAVNYKKGWYKIFKKKVDAKKYEKSLATIEKMEK